ELGPVEFEEATALGDPGGHEGGAASNSADLAGELARVHGRHCPGAVIGEVGYVNFALHHDVEPDDGVAGGVERLAGLDVARVAPGRKAVKILGGQLRKGDFEFGRHG